MVGPMLTNDNRLRWQCRRGMLELDLLLQQFLSQGYRNLDQPARQQFARMLEYPDQLLLEWLMGKAVPADREVRNIVQSIRCTLTN
jgi:antitoxin CptB